MADVIPQKELRNNVGEALRRAEAGERLTITVSGRPVAELGPLRRAAWVPEQAVAEIFRSPADPSALDDVRGLGSELPDPFDR